MRVLASLLIVLLTATTGGAAVFTWNPNGESDMSHYKLYECLESESPCLGGSQVGPNVTHPTTTLTIPDPASTKNYSLSATDTSGNESGRSNTVTKVITATSQTLTGTNGTFELFANNDLTHNGVLIDSGYNALRLCNGAVEVFDISANSWWKYDPTDTSNPTYPGWVDVPEVCPDMQSPSNPSGLSVQ